MPKYTIVLLIAGGYLLLNELGVIPFLAQGWVLLVLIASFMFAIGNYIDELLLDKYEQEVGTLVLISSYFGGALSVFFFAIVFWQGNSLLTPGADIIAQAIGIGVLEIIWVIPYLYAINRRGALVAGPLFQGVPVVALGLEALWGVIPPIVQIGGALLIVLGGILLSIERDEEEDGEVKSRIDWLTIGLMTVSMLIVALIYVLFKDAAEGDHGFSVIGFWSGVGMVLTGVLIHLFTPPYRRQFAEFRRQARGKALAMQLFNECMDSGGVYLTHLANTIGPSVMLVTAFNASQPIAIMIVGGCLAWFGVNDKASKLWWEWAIIMFAIGFIAAGVVILALN